MQSIFTSRIMCIRAYNAYAYTSHTHTYPHTSHTHKLTHTHKPREKEITVMSEPSPTIRVFVFGSDTAGRHGAGAAAHAHYKYGAIYGIGEGFSGGERLRTYALPTLDENLRQRSIAAIQESVERFLGFCRNAPQTIFHVTRVGCGLAGFTDDQIAPLFINAPPNCEFDPLWKRFGLPSFTISM